MNILKAIGKWIAGGLRKLANRIDKRVSADKISDAYQQFLDMKSGGMDTNATKLFNQLRDEFETKHGKSLTDELTEEEKEEADSIAQAFMDQPTATEEKIEEAAADLNIEETDKQKKAKSVDAMINRIEADRRARVLTSVVEHAVWENAKENNKSVKAMDLAIKNVTDYYENLNPGMDGYDEYSNSTAADRENAILQEYDRILEELGL